jgi:hypothetical protein
MSRTGYFFSKLYSFHIMFYDANFFLKNLMFFKVLEVQKY